MRRPANRSSSSPKITRQISNLVADVQEDGVHLTFELTIISDGTSNTLSIIAVLIGLYRPEVSALELENTMVSNFTSSPRQRQAVTSLITRAWRNYARDAFAAARVGGKMHLEDVSLGYHADGIYFYATDGVTNY